MVDELPVGRYKPKNSTSRDIHQSTIITKNIDGGLIKNKPPGILSTIWLHNRCFKLYYEQTQCDHQYLPVGLSTQSVKISNNLSQISTPTIIQIKAK